MTRVTLLARGGREAGFELSGHATADAQDDEGGLVCAALSSAALMAANTITEVLGEKAAIDQRDGYLRVVLAHTSAEAVQILRGFAFHIRAMADEHPGRIHIETEEIKNA